MGNVVPLFSAVLVPTEYVEPAKGVRVGGRQQHALDSLKRLTVEHEQRLEDAGYDLSLIHI